MDHSTEDKVLSTLDTGIGVWMSTHCSHRLWKRPSRLSPKFVPGSSLRGLRSRGPEAWPACAPALREEPGTNLGDAVSGASKAGRHPQSVAVGDAAGVFAAEVTAAARGWITKAPRAALSLGGSWSTKAPRGGAVRGRR